MSCAKPLTEVQRGCPSTTRRLLRAKIRSKTSGSNRATPCMSREAVMRLQRFAAAFLLVAAVPVFCQTDANVPTATPDAAQSDTPAPPMNPSSSRPEPAAPVSNVERDEMQVHPPTSDLEDQ